MSAGLSPSTLSLDAVTPPPPPPGIPVTPPRPPASRYAPPPPPPPPAFPFTPPLPHSLSSLSSRRQVRLAVSRDRRVFAATPPRHLHLPVVSAATRRTRQGTPKEPPESQTAVGEVVARVAGNAHADRYAEAGRTVLPVGVERRRLPVPAAVPRTPLPRPTELRRRPRHPAIRSRTRVTVATPVSRFLNENPSTTRSFRLDHIRLHYIQLLSRRLGSVRSRRI